MKGRAAILAILTVFLSPYGAAAQSSCTRGYQSELGVACGSTDPADSPIVICILGSVSVASLPLTNLRDIPSVMPSITARTLVTNQDPLASGGLSLSGDVDEGRARLNWIVGDPGGSLLVVDDHGMVSIDNHQLAVLAGVADERDPGASLQIAQYISSDEGLLLMVQMIGSRNRYRLHIGPRAPTMVGDVSFKGCINLDNRYDSRINPRRKEHKKTPQELPPAGLDSLVAVSPDSHWFNVNRQREVLPGQITFHELAEAYAKIDLGLDYLPIGPQPGAHDEALAREARLNSERPSSPSVVSTDGLNWLFDSTMPLTRVKSIFAAISGDRRGR